MRVVYDPTLAEEVVFNELRRREMAGDAHLFAAYHEDVDAIYENIAVEERGGHFERLHIDYFKRSGFDGAIRSLVGQFPLLRGRADAVAIIKTANKYEEGANVTEGTANVAIRVRPEIFEDSAGLRRFLNHELMHASDMLDPAFGYHYEKRLGAGPPSMENLIRERYRVIWDIYIDSRLSKKGIETVADREGRCGEFEAIYRKVASHLRPVLFETLWEREALTHGQILEMAGDAGSLMQRLGREGSETLKEEGPHFFPGDPCPLCRFPTYTWVDLLSRSEDGVLEAIAKDYPEWGPAQGVCERCIECYEVRAGLW